MTVSRVAAADLFLYGRKGQFRFKLQPQQAEVASLPKDVVQQRFGALRMFRYCRGLCGRNRKYQPRDTVLA